MTRISQVFILVTMDDLPRYLIGIDLGTTNSCVAYVDTDTSSNPGLGVQIFPIPQLSAEGFWESQNTLPSFCYLPGKLEFSSSALSLPWDSDPSLVVGQFAKEQGTRTPTRLVGSAKSWLCNPAADRKERILPVEAPANERKMSPLEASTAYLDHIRCAWNHQVAKGDTNKEFEQQQIVLTVPASFDEVARALTVEAAKSAGYQQVTLLEEPQAAFYSWIAQHHRKWKQHLSAGQQILVVDVGGGTTDLSLIQVEEGKEGLRLNRTAVGEHLLLGGDNMDAAIAHLLEQKLGTDLTPLQWMQLRHHARAAKEVLFSPSAPDCHRVVLQGKGRSLVKGSLSAEISREELCSILSSGFFGSYDWKEATQLRKKSGIRSMGLPYEEEPSIIKHIAAFLQRVGGETPIAPDSVLFNGGATKPLFFQEAVISNLEQWTGKRPEVLTTVSLDLSVARGAAYFGKVRRGLGERIGGGCARGFYLGLELKDSSEPQALTLLPRGSEEGSHFISDRKFLLRSNSPICFQVYTSHTRLSDPQGSLIPIQEEELHPLPTLQTILRFGKGSSRVIPVRVEAELTEVGTLALWLQSQESDHRWNLEFQLRSASGEEDSLSLVGEERQDEVLDQALVQNLQELIVQVFSKEPPFKPSRLLKALEEKLEQSRWEWSPSLLRALWDAVYSVAEQRLLSSEHHVRWWNLIGFLLRPGRGAPLDDHRIKNLWKIVLAEPPPKAGSELSIQRWICFRRIAAGLSKGQQQQVAHEILSSLLPKKSKVFVDPKKSNRHEFEEKLRALASMELLPLPMKTRIGEALLQRITSGKAAEADFWSLGRIGARHLLAGSLAHVVPPQTAEKWVQLLLDLPQKTKDLGFTLVQLARHTGHREIDLSSELIEQVKTRCGLSPEALRLQDLLTHSSRLSAQEQGQVLGDRLPLGLILESE